LGFHWDNKFYYDTALLSSSCQLFESFSTSLQWILNQKFNIKGISHLLEDFFFVGKANTNDCFKVLQTFVCLADILGVPIKAEKTQLPSTCITIYGIEIDSKQMVARLPGDKIQRIVSLNKVKPEFQILSRFRIQRYPIMRACMANSQI
jgi:hypothetical protein